MSKHPKNVLNSPFFPHHKVEKLLEQSWEDGAKKAYQDMLKQIEQKLQTITEVPGIGKELQSRIIKHFSKPPAKEGRRKK